MKILFVFLTGYALFGQPGHALAQGGAAAPRDQPAATQRPQAPTPGQGVLNPAQLAANQAQLKACCQKIARDMQRIYYLNNRNGKVRLVVRGIYTRGRALFFSLRLINRSPLDYDVDSIRFFVTAKQKGVHPARRLNELMPVYVFDSATQVKGYSRATSVLVIPRMSLARHRRLLIEVSEKNGGRQLLVQASNFTLETARLI